MMLTKINTVITVTQVTSVMFRSCPYRIAKSPSPPDPTAPAMAVNPTRLIAVIVVPLAMADTLSRK